MIKDTITANEGVAPNSREMEVLKENFPGCFRADGSFDIERFKEFLSDKVSVVHEGYELRFLGKNYARLLASLDTTTVVVPDEAHNSKPENAASENIYISGDNLDALKHLLKSYARRVKCIYIDPPYNTGSDGFVYRDSFDFTVDELSTKLSIDEGQAEHILDLARRGSASHSAWLMFIYPRLVLARDLLKDDGAIFISIDGNEVHDLKIVCDDLFGEDNCIGVIANVNNPKGRSDDKFIATAHEYILAYARNIESVIWNGFEPTEKIIKRYNKVDRDGRRYREIDLRKTGENDLREDRPKLFYYFYYCESTGDFYPDIKDCERPGYIQIKPQREDGHEGNWRWGIETARERIGELIPKFMPSREVWGVMQKDFLDNRSLVKPTSAWTFKDVNSERGTEEFTALGFDKRVFPKPKPVGTISRCISLCTRDGDIVVDFFAGSSTTAQAVMNINAAEAKNRKYILVQTDEQTKEHSKAKEAGFETIDQIGTERIIRAAAKIREEYPDTAIDLGFKHFTLKEPDQNTLDKLETFDPDEGALHIANTVLDDFGLPTVLTTWLVRDGYGFAAPVQEIDFAGYKGYHMDKHLYLISPELSNAAIETVIAKYETDGAFNPENVVLFGYSFVWTELETLKTNLKRLKDTEKNLRINFDVRY